MSSRYAIDDATSYRYVRSPKPRRVFSPGPRPDRVEPPGLSRAERRIDVDEIDRAVGKPTEDVQRGGQQDAARRRGRRRPSRRRPDRSGRHDRRQLDDVARAAPSLQRLLRRTHPRAPAVHQRLGRVLPLVALQVARRRDEPLERGVRALPSRDDDQLARARERRARSAPSVPAPAGTARRSFRPCRRTTPGPSCRAPRSAVGAGSPTQMTSDFFRPSSNAAGSFAGNRLQHHLEVDLRDQLAFQQERREVRARLREASRPRPWS